LIIIVEEVEVTWLISLINKGSEIFSVESDFIKFVLVCLIVFHPLYD
jgi:hypothetical protein